MTDDRDKCCKCGMAGHLAKDCKWPTQPAVLYWPPSALSPNARHGHWAPLAEAKAKLRTDAAYLAKAAGWGLIQHDGRVMVSIEFRPPDRRRYDLDNLLARLKAGLDGLADVIGIDDRHWRLTLDIGEPVKFGRVIVTIKPLLEPACSPV